MITVRTVVHISSSQFCFSVTETQGHSACLSACEKSSHWTWATNILRYFHARKERQLEIVINCMSTFGGSIWTSKWGRLGKTISNYWTEHDRSICLWSLRHFGGGWRKADCFKCCPERLREKLAVVFSSGDLLPNAPMQLDKSSWRDLKDSCLMRLLVLHWNKPFFAWRFIWSLSILPSDSGMSFRSSCLERKFFSGPYSPAVA